MKLLRTLPVFVALAGASSIAIAEKAPVKPAEKAPAPAPAPTAPVVKKETLSAPEAAKVEKFFNELVDAMVKHQDNCKNMAGAINTLFDKNEAWLRKAAETGKDLPDATKEKMGKRQGEMMTAAMKCKDDADVGKAMQRFASIGPKKSATPPPTTK